MSTVVVSGRFGFPQLSGVCATLWPLSLALAASLLLMSATARAQVSENASQPLQTTTAAPLRVVVPGSGKALPHEPYYYYVQLLRLALEKTRASHGDFQLDFHDHAGGIERDRAMLMANAGIDAMWASVTPERADKLRVINVDLLKGLNNYRALLIHRNQQSRFAAVTSLEQLRQFKTGTGPYWTDGLILKENGFTLVYGANYNGLFKMLAKHRFDFFSRGLHEIYDDLLRFTELGLVREPNLLLRYEQTVPYSFFVNKNNHALAQRLEQGLLLAQADGSFDALFMSIASFKYGYEVLQNTHQRVLVLHNRGLVTAAHRAP